MNIAAILQARASEYGEQLAIVERGQSITFGALDRATASAAAELAASGITAGMRVLVFSRMSIGLYTTMIALFRLRATAVFIDPSVGRRRLNRCVERVRPGAFVAIPRAHWLRISSRAIRRIPITLAIGGRVPGAATIGRRVRASGHPVEPCAPDTPAIITFTSGSTGEPKAAVRTHGFLLAQHHALVEALALAPGDVDLCTLPIFLLANLASGVTSVIPDADLRAVGAIDPGPVARQIRDARPVRTVASPAFLARLAAHAAGRGETFDSFRRIYTGGAPVFPGLLDALASQARRASVVAVYGSTEAEPIAEIERRAISAADRTAMAQGAGLLAGLPVRAIRVRILSDAWGTPRGPWREQELDAHTLPVGAAGEIVVAGEHVLTGYLDGTGDEETKIRTPAAVWHRTGDAGYLDADGRLWLLGRCAAKVTDARGAIYPFAVEAAASDVAGVIRTAFVLHEGRRVLVAELAGEPGDSQARLLARLQWAKIDDVRIVSRIPVDQRHNAKVDYPALRRLLAAVDRR
jgi:acyl-CoA synthetase (AMP-forming)/AMP-acid ligase II